MENDILKRIEVLENTQKQILEGLLRIERRLVGNIEEDKPGLLDDMRFLRRTVESIDAKVILIEKINMQARIEALENDLKVIKEKVDDLNKYRLILYGGIIVAVFAIEKVWSYLFK